MLRALVVALLVANLAFFAWSQGWLDAVVGVRARGDREPERLANQVRPESIVILPSSPAKTSVAAASCIEAGPFTTAEFAAAETALAPSVRPGAWTDVRTERAGVWLVYMGAFPDREAMLRKQAEIRRVRDFEAISVPGEGEFGLSLGRFDDREGAERALAQFQQRGIRTARVLQLNPPTVSHMLRIEGAEATLAARLTGSQAVALGLGKPFAACARSDAAR